MNLNWKEEINQREEEMLALVQTIPNITTQEDLTTMLLSCVTNINARLSALTYAVHEISDAPPRFPSRNG